MQLTRTSPNKHNCRDFDAIKDILAFRSTTVCRLLPSRRGAVMVMALCISRKGDLVHRYIRNRRVSKLGTSQLRRTESIQAKWVFSCSTAGVSYPRVRFGRQKGHERNRFEKSERFFSIRTRVPDQGSKVAINMICEQ
jgi:hypothetical protein